MSSRSDLRKTVEKIRKDLRKQGWTTEQSKKGHWHLTSPNGDTVYAQATPSSYRGVLNLVSQLRKYGADVST